MAWKDVREQIKVILSSVDNTGIIHDYDRWSNDWGKIIDLFKDADDKYRGCIITRIATPEHWLTNFEYERVFDVFIRFVFGLKDSDATERIFQDTIEDIVTAFRNKNTLNGSCETIQPEFGKYKGKSGVQIEKVTHRKFGSVLCHYAEMGLGIQVKGQIR